MNKYFAELPRHIKQMTKEELLDIFPASGKDEKDKYTNAFLMRSIIINEKQFLEVDYDRSLRELWYSTVKPTLDKLGLLSDEDQTEEGLTKWDATLSKYVAELVKGGYLTYADLRILDISRQKEIPVEIFYSVEPSVYGYQGTVAPYPNILVVCEKDTVFSEIKGLSRLLGCSCLSAKGQPAFAAIEYLVREMIKQRAKNYFHTIYVVSFTDYDPSGYMIAEAVYSQIKTMSEVLGTDLKVSRTRVGLEPTQLTDEQVQANWYSPKGANGHPQKSVETVFDNWYNLTDGIQGERKGLETEALPREELRRVFVEKIFELGIINKKVYEGFVKQSYLTKLGLETIQNDVRWLHGAVIRKFENSVILSEDFDIEELAIAGNHSIPISRVCSIEGVHKVKQEIKKLFAAGINTQAIDLLHKWYEKFSDLEEAEDLTEVVKATRKLLGL